MAESDNAAGILRQNDHDVTVALFVRMYVLSVTHALC